MDTKRLSPKPVLISAFVALALSASALLPGATAQTATVTTSANVPHSDLDLSQPAGARVMLARLNSAAHEVCGAAPSPSPLLPRAGAQHRTCVSDAVGRAVGQLGAPMVAALHTGRPPAGSTFASR